MSPGGPQVDPGLTAFGSSARSVNMMNCIHTLLSISTCAPASRSEANLLAQLGSGHRGGGGGCGPGLTRTFTRQFSQSIIFDEDTVAGAYTRPLFCST